MKGDFTRDTFDPLKHFSRVLMQQGRVTLDADYNEQSAIVLHYLRTLARDLIGPYAAPFEKGGFLLSVNEDDGVRISSGRYYVDGILVENETECAYNEQPNYSLGKNDPLLAEVAKPTGRAFWLYLDVWEQHITSVEDDSIRDSALGGPDTCTRSKVVWQVKALPVDLPADNRAKTIRRLQDRQAQLQEQLKNLEDPAERKVILNEMANIDAQIKKLSDGGGDQPEMACDAPITQLVGLSAASLAARVDPGRKSEDACVTPPDSKYRGVENQLYRVEIHRGGKVEDATFKWSRDNGSGETSWLGTSGNDLQVANTRGFAAGNWVELSDDISDLLGKPGILLELAKAEGGTLTVDPSATLPTRSDDSRHPKVRRWDHVATDAISLAGDNAVPIQESPAGATPEQIVWIDLEDGVQIQFSAGGEYRTGDYWLIPARVATGNVEWPQADDLNPQPLPPHGVEHHYAPLGFVQWSDNNFKFVSCRCEFEPLSSCFSMGSVGVGEHLLTEVRFQPAPVAKPTRKRKRRKRSPS